MSQDQETRPRSGSSADRAPLNAMGPTAVLSGVVGFIVANADWVNTMVQAHHYVTPDNALMVMWATALAPTATLIYHIWIKRLQKIAGDQT